jgi:hypothetical protein
MDHARKPGAQPVMIRNRAILLAATGVLSLRRLKTKKPPLREAFVAAGVPGYFLTGVAAAVPATSLKRLMTVSVISTASEA